jgi:hypothetical protein
MRPILGSPVKATITRTHSAVLGMFQMSSKETQTTTVRFHALSLVKFAYQNTFQVGPYDGVFIDRSACGEMVAPVEHDLGSLRIVFSFRLKRRLYENIIARNYRVLAL